MMFELLSEHGERVLEIDLHCGGARRLLAPEVQFGVIAEKAAPGDQHEVCVQFLFHTALRLGMKRHDCHRFLRSFEQFFNSPAAVIDLAQTGAGKPPLTYQSSGERVLFVSHRVFDQAQAQRRAKRIGMARVNALPNFRPRRDFDDGFAGVALHELIDHLGAFARHAENRIDLPQPVFMQKT